MVDRARNDREGRRNWETAARLLEVVHRPLAAFLACVSTKLPPPPPRLAADPAAAGDADEASANDGGDGSSAAARSAPRNADWRKSYSEQLRPFHTAFEAQACPGTRSKACPDSPHVKNSAKKKGRDKAKGKTADKVLAAAAPPAVAGAAPSAVSDSASATAEEETADLAFRCSAQPEACPLLKNKYKNIGNINNLLMDDGNTWRPMLFFAAPIGDQLSRSSSAADTDIAPLLNIATYLNFQRLPAADPGSLLLDEAAVKRLQKACSNLTNQRNNLLHSIRAVSCRSMSLDALKSVGDLAKELLDALADQGQDVADARDAAQKFLAERKVCSLLCVSDLLPREDDVNILPPVPSTSLKACVVSPHEGAPGAETPAKMPPGTIVVVFGDGDGAELKKATEDALTDPKASSVAVVGADHRLLHAGVTKVRVGATVQGAAGAVLTVSVSVAGVAQMQLANNDDPLASSSFVIGQSLSEVFEDGEEGDGASMARMVWAWVCLPDISIINHEQMRNQHSEVVKHVLEMAFSSSPSAVGASAISPQQSSGGVYCKTCTAMLASDDELEIIICPEAGGKHLALKEDLEDPPGEVAGGAVRCVDKTSEGVWKDVEKKPHYLRCNACHAKVGNTMYFVALESEHITTPSQHLRACFKASLERRRADAVLVWNASKGAFEFVSKKTGGGYNWDVVMPRLQVNTGLSFSIEPVWPDELPLPPGQVDASGKDVKLADLGREAIMQRLNDPDISGVSEVYEYQHELIKEIVGTDGNSLVILPTGAGKTLIAELMIDIVLDNHPNGLAVMIAPTVALVQQQAESLRRHLKRAYQIVVVAGGKCDWCSRAPSTGDTVEKLPMIVVATPGALQTLMKPSKAHKTRLAWEHMAIMVLDEAHHAAEEKSPLGKLMKAYQALSGEAAKPRVLGLTAVLSSEPQKLLDALRPAKLHSPQNLYSSNAWQQLEPEVIEAAQTKLDERLVDQLRRVAPMLREAANEAEEIDWSFGIAGNEQALMKRGALLPHMVMASTAQIPEVYSSPSAGASPGEQREAVGAEGVAAARSSSFWGKMGYAFHAILRHLEERDESFPLRKVIVFVQRRRQTTRSVDMFAKYCAAHTSASDQTSAVHVEAAARLVGSSAMTRQQQKDVLERFASPQGPNVLMATSVAEEGLDVPRCTMVVFTMAVRTLRTLIQGRGRARDRGQGSRFLCIEDPEERRVLDLAKKEKEAMRQVKAWLEI